MKSMKIPALIAGAALLLTGCSSSEPAGEADAGSSSEVQSLTVAVYGSGEEGVIDIAEEQGYFDEVGIEVEKVIIGAPPAVIAATQAGEVDIAMSPVIPGLTAMANGVPLVIVAGVDGFPAENAQDYDAGPVMVNPDSGFADFGDLEGATIAVPARGAMYEVVITAVLEDEGVDPSSINWVTMDFGAALDAVVAGDIDAAPSLPALDAGARANGLVELGFPGSAFTGEGPIDLWVTSPETAESKQAAVQGFHDAVMRAADWGNENVEEVKELALEISGLELSVDEIKPIHFETSVNVEALERMSKRLVALGFIEQEPELTILD